MQKGGQFRETPLPLLRILFENRFGYTIRIEHADVNSIRIHPNDRVNSLVISIFLICFRQFVRSDYHPCQEGQGVVARSLIERIPSIEVDEWIVWIVIRREHVVVHGFPVIHL
jgi:hypothetical protein